MNKIYLIAGVALLIGALYFHNQIQDDSYGTIPEEYVAKFTNFKKTFNKKYGSNSEDQYRLHVFYVNIKDAERNNADPSSTFTMGQTKFSDLTPEEFAAQYLSLKNDESLDSNSTDIYEDAKFESKSSVDWRQKPGVSTHVKDQGQCGSCWAFSAVGAIEAFYATVEAQKDLDLSEQQIVHCSKEGNYGCSGGWPLNALKWVTEHGLVSQIDYPYTATDGECKIDKGLYKISKAKQVANDENSLKSAIKLRPVSVCLDASTWFQYTEGILNVCSMNINHAVLAFGYDKGYWLIKNSWGRSWGEQGFIRIKDGNTCNILSNSYLAE